MLSQCGIKYRKTTKNKRLPCNFKIRYSKRYTRRNCKWSKDSLENDLASSLATKYIDNPEEEPLFLQFYEAKQDLQKRQRDIQGELENVRVALKDTLENDLLPLLPKKGSNTETFGNSTEEEVPSNILENSDDVQDTVTTQEQNSVKCVTENDYSYGICTTDYDGLSVSATTEESGNFEIKTVHSCGSIKTYIMHSASGNIEIVTQVEDYDVPLSQSKSEESVVNPQLIVPQNSASTEVLQDFHSTISKTEITTTKPKVVYTPKSLKEVRISNVYENVMTILQKLNDSVVYALEHINNNISKTLENLNQNMKLALTVVVRDEIRKVITEHMSDKKTLVCTSTSHNDLCLKNDIALKEDCSTSTVEDVKTVLCSATITIESFLPNKVCSIAIQTEDLNVSVSTITDNKEEPVCQSTSVTDLAPVHPNKIFEKTGVEEEDKETIEVAVKEEEEKKKSNVEITYSQTEEVKPQIITKRKVRSTKLTAPTNIQFGARVESVCGAHPKPIDLPKPSVLVPPVLTSLAKENNIMVYVEDESSVCKNLRTTKDTEIIVLEKRSVYSNDNSEHSAPSSSVVSQAPTEEVSHIKFNKHPNNNVCSETNTLITIRNSKSSQSSHMKNQQSEEQSSERPKSITSESEKLRSPYRYKKRRFTKSRSKNSESLIGLRGKVHKLDEVTVNKILKKNNAMYIQKGDENGGSVKNVRSLLNQLRIEHSSMPHSAGCDCFECVYSEYRRKRKNSNLDHYAKIGHHYDELVTKRIYDSHVQKIEDNFQKQEKVISDIEENLKERYIKEVCKYAKEHKEATYEIQEASLFGLKHALCSLKSKIQQIDKTIVTDKTVQPKDTSTKKTKTEVSTVTLFKQPHLQTRISKSKRDIAMQQKKKCHKTIQKIRPITPTHFKSMQREQSRKTLSHEKMDQLKTLRYQKLQNQNFDHKQQELICIQSCEKELYNFFERKKQPAGLPKKSVSVSPTIPSKRKGSKKQETKNKSSTRSISEATMSKTTTTTLIRDEKSNKRYHLK